jgi:hypothetical protein
MAYPTLDAVLADTEVPELTGASGPSQEALYLAAIQAIEEFTGQSFADEDTTLDVDAAGGRVIFLPRRLETLLSIDGSVPPTDIALSPAGDRLTVPHRRAWGYYEKTMRELSHETDPGFARGSVAITGTWGWTVAPPAVAMALRLDMEDNARADANDLSGTVAGLRAMGLRSISQGNLSLAWGGSGDASGGGAAVVTPRAARLLTGFVWYGPGGELV